MVEGMVTRQPESPLYRAGDEGFNEDSSTGLLATAQAAAQAAADQAAQWLPSMPSFGDAFRLDARAGPRRPGSADEGGGADEGGSDQADHRSDVSSSSSAEQVEAGYGRGPSSRALLSLEATPGSAEEQEGWGGEGKGAAAARGAVGEGEGVGGLVGGAAQTMAEASISDAASSSNLSLAEPSSAASSTATSSPAFQRWQSDSGLGVTGRCALERRHSVHVLREIGSGCTC